ncbi:MAG: beta-lactamase family protein [Clostridia bacterium]|nr:beta-lactamase family protein [Clostridia bacterium]
MKILDKEKLSKSIEEIANYDLENNNIFGSSYCVLQSGNVVYKKHFGYSDAEGITPVSDKTLFRLASMTKPITGVAMVILEERGLISLDDPVKKYIPELEHIHVITSEGNDLGETKTDVTIRHCLTHTSGFGNGDETSMTDKDRETIESTIRYFTKAGLCFEPATQSMYSGFGAFDLLGAVAQKVSGMDYGAFLKEAIFDPCGMTDTTFSPTEEQYSRIITMHNKVDRKKEKGITYEGCVFEKIPYGHNLAGAGLVSSMNDYVKFAGMLASGGKCGDKQILSKESVNNISTPCVPFSWAPDKESWGLSVRVVTSEKYEKLPVGCYGWSGAYGTHFWIDPENEICAVFMKNSRFDGGAGTMSGQRFEIAVRDSLIE